MTVEILMPALSPTMTEGNLVKWLKKVGDEVNPGEVIAEIETDKATMEVEAVDSGTLGKIVVEAGTQSVKVNSLIALLLEEGEDSKKLGSYTASPVKQDNTATPVKSAQSAAVTIDKKPVDRVMASPLAKRLAEQKHLDLAKVKGTGPHGRIIKADVLETKVSTAISQDEYTPKPNSSVRKVIAKRLCESKQNVPHFYLTISCQLDKLLAIRKEINEATEKSGQQLKISVNDILIKACGLALKQVPEANVSWTDEAILLFNNADVSVAVALEDGLITPIIRNADQKTLGTISTEMKGLIGRAKSSGLKPEEFQGGGFCISNLGMYGIRNFAAIINPPQGCILAVGAGEEVPVVKNGKIEIANVMEATLSCDHRAVDGAIGAKFLQAFKKYVENPTLMML